MSRFVGISYVLCILFHLTVLYVWVSLCLTASDVSLHQPTKFANRTCQLYLCDALPQNREQMTFWVKWVFGIIVRSILSVLSLYQNLNSYSYRFLRYDHLCIRPWAVSLEVWFLEFASSYSYKCWIWQAAENDNFFFLFLVVKCLKISQKLHGSDRKHIKVCKKKKKKKPSKLTDESFSLLCQLQLFISQNRHVQLVPCFIWMHHIFEVVYNKKKKKI